MPAGQGKDAERFAAAVESRTPLVSADDAELARDLEIVAMLRSRGGSYAPGAETKARAKQRLMAALAEEAGPDAEPDHAPRRGVPRPAESELTAPLDRFSEPASPARDDEDTDATAETARMAPVTARLQTERGASAESAASIESDRADRADRTSRAEDSDEDAETTGARAPGRPGRASRRARHRVANRPAGGPRSGRRPAPTGLRRRALLVGSAAMVMMLAMAGGGIFASRDALPGENLYAIKQVTESAGLALTFDEASRARRHLEIAATRLSEVERLAAREADTAPAPEVIDETMDEFNAATDEGSRLLLESADEPAAEATADDAAAGDLREWATTQSERLSELRNELPAEADTEESLELLDRLLGRAKADNEALACDEDDDCATRRTSGANESGGSDGSEDGATEDSTPTDESDSADSSETDDEDEPTGTATPTPDGENPRLLPDLLPDAEGEREDSTTTSTTGEDEESTSTSKSESDSDSDSDSGSEESGDEEDGDNMSVPLPLLPPVTLPPLLPGMPGITLG